MHILIEASEIYRNHTGIGRYNLNWLRCIPLDTPFRLSFSPVDYHLRHHPGGIRTTYQRLSHAFQHAALTQLTVCLAANQTRPDIIHALNFAIPITSRLPRIMTLFDLAYFDLPGESDGYWRRYGQAMIPHFARQAHAIITPSEASKIRIVERLNLSAEKIHIVHGSVTSAFHPVTHRDQLRQVRETYHLPEHFILYAGGWQQSKNLSLLLRAFARLSRGDLVISGIPHSSQQAKFSSLAQQTHGGRVHFAGWIAEADLPAVYSLARAVVLPSLYEGFGLTLLEALACGTPVIASDIPVLREVGGAVVEYISPHSVEDWRAMLESLVATDRPLDNQERLKQAHRFTANASAQQMMDVWRQVMV